MYSQQLDKLLLTHFNGDVDKLHAFFVSMFVRTITEKPVLYINKIRTQLIAFIQNPFHDSRQIEEVTDVYAREIMEMYPKLAWMFPESRQMNGKVQGILQK